MADFRALSHGGTVQKLPFEYLAIRSKDIVVFILEGDVPGICPVSSIFGPFMGRSTPCCRRINRGKDGGHGGYR